MRRSDQLWMTTGALAVVFGAYSILEGDWRVAGVFALGLLAVTGLWMLFGRLETPLWIQALAAALVLSAWIGGDVLSLYERFAWWDLYLHGLAGVVLTLIGHHWLSERMDQPAIPAFLMTMGAGALWEIWELAWSVNLLTHPLEDAITDLIVKAVLAGLTATLLAVSSSCRTRTRR